ncbi:MAG: D-aminoacyl-tRNA deacylase [Eubacteriaceae bacterium]|jgi:D-tyrosyl-tRNA(Tyr) deacylase|nr:D-aminoacyl-tRNA deacylase [Eubacteriaceae bacterium]
MGRKAVFFICDRHDWGHVSFNVWDILREEGFLDGEAGFTFDGGKVMKHIDEAGNEYYFAPTKIAICLDYPHYLPEMNEHFSDFDVSGMVTWHEGASAPQNVLTVHSLGDVVSGIYDPADPRCMRNLILGIDRERQALRLDDYSVVTEATHWSGAYDDDSDPSLLIKFPVPMMDIEVGSDPASWDDMDACRALARGLMHVFDDDGLTVHNLLCVGGIHFQPDWAEAVFRQWDGQTFGITHIIANQWLVDGEYENEKGIARTEACISAIAGGVEAIVFHDKMKACYKDLVRTIGAEYDIPIYKHQRLRNPETLEFAKH